MKRDGAEVLAKSARNDGVLDEWWVGLLSRVPRSVRCGPKTARPFGRDDKWRRGKHYADMGHNMLCPYGRRWKWPPEGGCYKCYLRCWVRVVIGLMASRFGT